MRFAVLLPLACSIAGFVLAMLCLFAGHKPGYMEDYAVVRLNMSTLGHNLLPTPTTGGDSPSQTASGLGGLFSSVLKNITDTIEGELDKIGDDIVDELAHALGIQQWYSVHVMDLCEGSFSPNASTPGAGLNVTNCTAQMPGVRVNLSQILDHELEIGPVNLNLADLDWPSSIQDQLDKLNGLLLAVFVLYTIGIAFAGLAILAAAVTFFLPSAPARGGRLAVLANLSLAGLSALALLIGSIATTVGAHEAASTVSDMGAKVGVSAEPGQKFIVLSWVAYAVMAVATLYWAVTFFLDWRARKRVWREKSRV